CQHSYNVPLTF
nr:immunoglobulin light chain junction region [Macaca mulatta]